MNTPSGLEHSFEKQTSKTTEELTRPNKLFQGNYGGVFYRITPFTQTVKSVVKTLVAIVKELDSVKSAIKVLVAIVREFDSAKDAIKVFVATVRELTTVNLVMKAFVEIATELSTVKDAMVSMYIFID